MFSRVGECIRGTKPQSLDSEDLIYLVSGIGHKVWAMKRGADLNASLAAIRNSFQCVRI